MAQKFTNQARTTLSVAASDVATSMTLASGSGDLFPMADVGASPLPAAGDWFKLTLTNLSDPFDPPPEVFVEIIYVRTRASGSSVISNVMRGQEGTTAREWQVGTVVGLRLTAEDLQQAVGQGWANIPQNSKSGSYTLLYTDGGKHISVSAGSITIPADVFAAGDVVCIYNNASDDRPITRSGGVTLWWVNGSNADRLLQQRGLATILCVAPNEFVISGQGVA
jgi:hypothetical protein